MAGTSDASAPSLRQIGWHAEALRPASAACFPGEASRCSCQSAKASAIAAGESPPVNLANARMKGAVGEIGGDGGIGRRRLHHFSERQLDRVGRRVRRRCG